ncbi:MAG: hypothetical protein AAF196_02900 [Planctomycetota bacterium]
MTDQENKKSDEPEVAAKQGQAPAAAESSSSERAEPAADDGGFEKEFGSVSEELRAFGTEVVRGLDEEDRQIAARALTQGIELSARAALGEDVERQAQTLKAITANLHHRSKRAVEEAVMTWTTRAISVALRAVLV